MDNDNDSKGDNEYVLDYSQPPPSLWVDEQGVKHIVVYDEGEPPHYWIKDGKRYELSAEGEMVEVKWAPF